MTSFVVNLKPAIDLSDDAFFELCCNNHELKFERNANGDLIIMSRSEERRVGTEC